MAEPPEADRGPAFERRVGLPGASTTCEAVWPGVRRARASSMLSPPLVVSALESHAPSPAIVILMSYNLASRR